jgi:hypothetical protein
MTQPTKMILLALTALTVLAAEAPLANAITLEALCDQPNVIRSVIRFSKKLRFPANALGLKPDNAYFVESAGPLSCIYDLNAGNAYDFGKYKATFRSPQYGQLTVISLKPVD